MIELRLIDTSDPLYGQECALREEVLLRPVGYDVASFARAYSTEDRFEHAIAVLEHPSGPRVVGCALLLPGYPDAQTGKVMQVAVDAQRRGESIGRRLMTFLEQRGFGELGLTTLFCHAQLPAVPFYERLGWTIEGERFEEAGIPHYRMAMRIQESGPAR